MAKKQYKSQQNDLVSLVGSGKMIAGIDEAGRGAWAGPVVAACVGWFGRCPIKGVLGDSKKLHPKIRESTFLEIYELQSRGKLMVGIGIVSAQIIDQLGIREANRLAMLNALKNMKNEKGIIKNGNIFLKIDGRDNYVFDFPDLPAPKYIVRGDSRVKQIMAASIMAKVTRDRLMVEYSGKYIDYAFDQHKGYGTKLHQNRLRDLGVCFIHRRSYDILGNH